MDFNGSLIIIPNVYIFYFTPKRFIIEKIFLKICKIMFQCVKMESLLLANSIMKTVHFSIKWNGMNINYNLLDK